MKKLKGVSLSLMGLVISAAILFSAIPAFAAAAVSIKAKTVDWNGDPLPGAGIILRGTENSEGKDYKAKTGEDGIAEIILDSSVTEGTFDLEQEYAPDGCERSYETVKIKIVNGVVYSENDNELAPYNNSEPHVFENSRNNPVEINIPLLIETRQTGEKVPGKASFTVKLTDEAQFRECGLKIVSESVETDGKGEFGGFLKLTVPESYVAILTDGFEIYEVNGGADGWTYSVEKYIVRVSFIYTDNTPVPAEINISKRVDSAASDNGFEEVSVNEARFINSYNKAADPAPSVPENKPSGNGQTKSPQTGSDNGCRNAIAFMCVCLAVGAVAAEERRIFR